MTPILVSLTLMQLQVAPSRWLEGRLTRSLAYAQLQQRARSYEDPHRLDQKI